MGIYNTLHLKNVTCLNCQHTQNWIAQFHYGDCWQFEYQLFDELRWNGNDTGTPGASIVLVEGITENVCQHCSSQFYVRIFIDDNKIVSASFAVKNILFPQDIEGDYLVIN